MEAQLDPIFQAAIDSKRVPCVAAVVYDGTGKAIYSKGYGHTDVNNPSSPEVTPHTPAMIWSCTKLVTSLACLQLIEQGKMSLDDPVEKYAPEIAKIQLIESYDADGKPKLRPITKKPTLLNLFTHTSGFSYDFFDSRNLKYRIASDLPVAQHVGRSSMIEYTDPFVFEAGAEYAYGVNNDWMGFVVQNVSGLSLAEYIDKNIIQPLGLKNTGGSLNDEQDKAFMTVHMKDSTGLCIPTPIRMASPAEVPCPGGHFMYGTTDDYAQILLALVNGGTHPVSGGQILKPETVKDYVLTDQIPRVGCKPDGIGVLGADCLAPFSCQGEFLPGVKKGWSCGLMMNLEDVPNGRPKGSGSWAGLGNCYYWVDPTNKIVGFLVGACLPFFDKDYLHLFDALERAVYSKPQAKEPGEAGSNFSGGEVLNPPVAAAA